MEDIEDNDSSQNSDNSTGQKLITKKKLANIVTTEDGTVHYCCIECPVRYLDKAELELHLCMHTKEYRYLCGICGKGLKRKEHLDRHTMEHKETRPHVCPECGKGFKRKEHLNIHLAVHRGERTHSCGICGRTFSRKDHVQKHLQTHGKEFSGLEVDNMSSEEVDIKSEIIDEYGTSYGEISNPTDYDQPQEIDPSDASTHVPILPCKGEEIRYPCYFCEKTYKIRSHLQAHLHTHINKDESHEVPVEFYPEMVENPDGDSQWSYNGSESETQDINQSIQDMGLLIPRLPSVKPKEIRPHECEICHKRFKRRQHLKVHMNVHQRLQHTIWCSLCNEGFYANAQFEAHKCTQSGDSGIEPEPIEVEPAMPISPESNENKIPPQGIKIINAMNDPAFTIMREKESSIPVPQKVYVCKFCSKPFRRKDHYKIHQHIHTGVKSFFCKECGKGFYRKDHLQKHVLVHQKVAKPTPLLPQATTSKKKIPDLYPIHLAPKNKKLPAKPAFNPSAKVQTPQQNSSFKPEITIHAPSSSKLRVPLQIKVPYQMVLSMENGEQRAVTVDPHTEEID